MKNFFLPVCSPDLLRQLAYHSTKKTRSQLFFVIFRKIFQTFFTFFLHHNMLCFYFKYDTIKENFTIGRTILKILRITFCILSALCLAAAIPIGAFFGWVWLVGLLIAAALFALLMFGAKNGFRRQTPAPKPDFMNSEEENEKINRANKE